MDEKNRFKLLSSFLTFFISSAAISFFFYQAAVVKYKTKIKKGITKEVVVDLTLIPEPVSKIEKAVLLKKPIIKTYQKTTQKKELTYSTKKSVKSLFDDVNITFEKKKFLKNVKNEIVQVVRVKPKKINFNEILNAKTFSHKKTDSKKALLALKKDIQIDTFSIQSSSGIENAYFDRVHKILASGWNPSTFYKNMSATVVIDIRKNGLFSYRIKRVLGSSEFIANLKGYLDDLSKKGLPKPKKRISVEINFIAKE